MEANPILKEFNDVFLEEMLGLLPRREIDFSIELIPGLTPISKDRYP